MGYTEKEVEAAADSLISWAFTDSRVELDKPVLIDLLKTDYEIVGRLPSEKDCEEMICGGEDGELNEQLEEDFPQTCEFIASHW